MASQNGEHPGPSRLGSWLGGMDAIKQARAWHRAAGPVFAKNVDFLGVRNIVGVRTLFLKAREGIWAQELQFESQTLLKRFSMEYQKLGATPADLPKKVSLTPHQSLPLKTR